MKRLLVLIAMISTALSASAQTENRWQLRLMPQLALGTKNNVQLPGNEGTRFSLNDELQRKNRAVFSPRVELEYNFKRHHLIATAALLRNRFEGSSSRDISYNGTTFAAGTALDANYRFNTYRLGYRYRIVDREKIKFELGATVLVRDAVISLENDSQIKSFYNVGVAPLLSYYLEWNTTDRFSLLSYGDALAVKVGRAEDIFAGMKYRFTRLFPVWPGTGFSREGPTGTGSTLWRPSIIFPWERNLLSEFDIYSRWWISHKANITASKGAVMFALWEPGVCQFITII